MHYEKKDTVRILMITVSALIYSFGMNSFVKSGNLFPGGYAGISRLLTELLASRAGIHISFSIIYFTCIFIVRH